MVTTQGAVGRKGSWLTRATIHTAAEESVLVLFERLPPKGKGEAVRAQRRVRQVVPVAGDEVEQLLGRAGRRGGRHF
jgi:hypothetical protein